MALIDENHPAASGDMLQYWKDQLINKRILAYEYDKAILKITRQEVESYTINTGQTAQTVRRHNLPELVGQLNTLREEIRALEGIVERAENGSGAEFIQVVPY